MAAGAVVEALDVIEDRGACLSACGEALPVDEFVLRVLQNDSMTALL